MMLNNLFNLAEPLVFVLKNFTVKKINLTSLKFILLKTTDLCYPSVPTYLCIIYQHIYFLMSLSSLRAESVSKILHIFDY